MKTKIITKISLALAASAAIFGAIQSQAQTLTTSYTNNFDLGGNTSSFYGSGSVASWVYWYNYPGGNSPMTCVYGLDADGNTNTSGCLEVDSPIPAGGGQNVFFGTFDNRWGYDFNTEANLLNFTNITFALRVAAGTPLSPNGDYGNIAVGIINASYGFQSFGTVNIPATASNTWIRYSVPIDHTQANLTDVPGIAFQIASWNSGGYPEGFTFTNYIDDLQVNLSPVKTPPPTLATPLQKATVGLNEIATTPGSNGEYDRYQVTTVNDTGLGFVDQPSVTYSWNIQSFPQNTGENFQQHFFIVGPGAPGPYDQAADWNFANVIFITVQQADNNGAATMNFRYKTNEPAGNGMIFNTTNPTNTASNPDGWPVEPVCSLNATSAVGNWSVNFANNNGVFTVTLNGPGGATTNFVFDAPSAALFADPISLCLGGQPNNPNGVGKAVVYGSFSVAGNDTPYSETFTNESNLNTNFWRDLSSDPNGDVFVPLGSAYWLFWSVPDAGFSLQAAPGLQTGAAGWADLSPLTILDNGQRAALLPQSSVPAGNSAFFRLIERTFSQLQVLLPGESNAPNTPTGKTGTPTPINSGDVVNVTVNAVDSTYHIISGVVDTISLSTTNDPISLIGNPAAMVNGTVTIQVQLNTSGSQTVTATDTTNTNIPTATSSTITVN